MHAVEHDIVFSPKADKVGLVGAKSPLSKRYKYYRQLLTGNGIGTKDFRVIGGYVLHRLGEALLRFGRLEGLIESSHKDMEKASSDLADVAAKYEKRLAEVEDELNTLRLMIEHVSRQKVKSNPEDGRKSAILAGMPVAPARKKKTSAKRVLMRAPKDGDK